MKNNEKLIELAALKLLEDLKPRVDFYTVDNAKSAIAYCLDSNTYKALAHAQEQLEVSQLIDERKRCLSIFYEEISRYLFPGDCEIVMSEITQRINDSQSDEEVTG